MKFIKRYIISSLLILLGAIFLISLFSFTGVSVLAAPVCGDGVVNQVSEECDLGSATNSGSIGAFSLTSLCTSDCKK